MGGTVSVESVEGRGTTFTIVLPRAPRGARSPVAAALV
jgi:signal transduction histidine kinase